MIQVVSFSLEMGYWSSAEHRTCQVTSLLGSGGCTQQQCFCTTGLAMLPRYSKQEREFWKNGFLKVSGECGLNRRELQWSRIDKKNPSH